MSPRRPDTSPRAVFRQISDGALLARFPEAGERDANRAAVSLAAVAAPIAGVEDAVPGARSLLVLFEPARVRGEDLAGRLEAGRSAVSLPERATSGRRLRIPVLYGGEAGPDLAELSRERGLTEEEFAARHAGGRYEAAFLGFSPGFAYLGGLAENLHHPRLATPRTRVPAGSVAIGGPYTGVYPAESPGGWRLIGRAPVRLFDPFADPPALLTPGDAVEFERIGPREFENALAHLSSRRVREPDREGTPILRIANAGVWTTVQGAPQHRWSRWGVPPGGALDPFALADGNRAVGNDPFQPALEMSLVGPELETLSALTAIVAGGRIDARRNGRWLDADRAFSLARGDRLAVGPISGSARAYLCVAGGLLRSPGALASVRLLPGDLVRAPERFGTPAGAEPVGTLASPAAEETGVVRVVLGPDEDRFSREGVATFLSSGYRVSAASDRRGIRLEGEPVSHCAPPDVPPEAAPLGAIQVALDGQPIVLGPDRPVTGGYARIATVASADFPIVGRAVPGSTLRFRVISISEALEARSKLRALSSFWERS